MASKNEISANHKLVIAEHLQRCEAVGMGIADIHRELMEVFSVKGKYELRQIAAVTSWLRSDALRAMRVNEINADSIKEPDKYESRESVNFGNETKSGSRQWVVHQFAANSTVEERRNRKCLLMPGRNPYDFDAFIGQLGYRAQNLVTYIDGMAPSATAEYVGNCRHYGIDNSRIGDLEELLPSEPEYIQDAYLDYFAQPCKKVERELVKLPIPPDGKSCIAFNLLAARDDAGPYDSFAKFSENFENLRGLTFEERMALGAIRSFDFLPDAKKMTETKDQRKASLAFSMAQFIGIGQKKHWICPELLTEIGKNVDPEFDTLDIDDQIKVIEFGISTSKEGAGATRLLAKSFDYYGLPPEILNSIERLGICVQYAAFNYPIIDYLAPSMTYISEEGHTPFITSFVKLQTRHKKNKELENQISFFLKLIIDFQKNYTKGMKYAVRIRDTHFGQKLICNEGDRLIAEIDALELVEGAINLCNTYALPIEKTVEEICNSGTGVKVEPFRELVSLGDSATQKRIGSEHKRSELSDKELKKRRKQKQQQRRKNR